MAATALTSITAVELHQQQQMDSVLQCLDTHIHVVSMDLKGVDGPYSYSRADSRAEVSLCRLPPTPQLHSLQLSLLRVQLQPGGGFPGVLGAAASLASLKKLQLSDCTMLGSEAALSDLPTGLEHLSICNLFDKTHVSLLGETRMLLPTAKLKQLQQLTFLELARISVRGLDRDSPALQPLQALTRLADLRLSQLRASNSSNVYFVTVTFTASMLSGAHHLTRLQLSAFRSVEADVLAGKSELRHLQLECSKPVHRGVESMHIHMAQLSYRLQPLQQQLTHLTIRCSRWQEHAAQGTPDALTSAISAFTACSSLQHVDLRGIPSWLPEGNWELLFPAGRQLPHLTHLNISRCSLFPSGAHTAPPGSCLVSCCPALRDLDLAELDYSSEQLAPLKGLSRLHTLKLSYTQLDYCISEENLKALCQLSWLQHLTALLFLGRLNDRVADNRFFVKVSPIQARSLIALLPCSIVDATRKEQYYAFVACTACQVRLCVSQHVHDIKPGAVHGSILVLAMPLLNVFRPGQHRLHVEA
jgi:hypothetical protein